LKKARKNFLSASRGFGGASAARSGLKVFWLLFFKEVTAFFAYFEVAVFEKMDCFAALAMTGGALAMTRGRSP
jgi:hypothetical protein